ncbi:NUDIX domain-containing protein [Naumannella sp. ID2617S]|nr:NUDIX domain-containing protein [Naumannella sp. ID2617S]
MLTRTPASWAGTRRRTPLAPGQPVAVPRTAATLVLLREGRGGLQAWLVRRSRGMQFGGVWAFPGGKQEPVDEQAADPLLACLRRECLEETGLDLAGPGFGEPPLPWSRWITPENHPQRYDTWFFLLLAPPGLEPRNTSTEADRAEWLSVAELVAADRDAPAEQVAMLPPTRSVLAELALLGSWPRIREVAAQRVIEPVTARLVPQGDGWRPSHPRRDGSWT